MVLAQISCTDCSNWKRMSQRLPWNRYGRRVQVYWDCADQSNCPKKQQQAIEEAAMRVRFVEALDK